MSSDQKPEPADIVSLRAQVPTTIEVGQGCDGSETVSVACSLTVRVFVSYTGNATLENLILTTSCTLPLFLTTDTVAGEMHSCTHAHNDYVAGIFVDCLSVTLRALLIPR